jgi:hypothetical protein
MMMSKEKQLRWIVGQRETEIARLRAGCGKQKKIWKMMMKLALTSS